MCGMREKYSSTCTHTLFPSVLTYGYRWNLHPPETKRQSTRPVLACWSWMQAIGTGDQMSINHITSCTGKRHSRLCSKLTNISRSVYCMRVIGGVGGWFGGWGWGGVQEADVVQPSRRKEDAHIWADAYETGLRTCLKSPGSSLGCDNNAVNV